MMLRVLLLQFAMTLACLAMATAATASREIHLHLYMHDITGGPGQTAVQTVEGPGPANPLTQGGHLGDTTVFDDALTEGPSPASRAVGRAHGVYVLAGLTDPVLMVSMTVALAGGAYDGSTVVVVGRDDVSAAVRELAVAGGTGAFRRATGHVVWRTAGNVSSDHVVLKLDIYATVPGVAATPSDGRRQAGLLDA